MNIMTKDSFFAFSDSSIWNNSGSTRMLEYNQVLRFRLTINAWLLKRRSIYKLNKTQPRQHDVYLLIHAVF